jgi:poly-beta-1,6-N-acetyl-D-glucosamine synthase
MLTTFVLFPLGGLLLIWLVYPLAVALLAALRRPRLHPPHPEAPTVSVVLATREPEAAIVARVRNCLETAYDPTRIEIVVALDGGGWAEMRDPVWRDPRVHLVAGDPEGGKAAALNAGVRASSGEILVFADTYQLFDSDTIPRLVDAFADPKLAAVSGRLDLHSRSATLAERYWVFERWLREREARVHSTVGVTGAVWAMRGVHWEPLPPGLILDDVYTPMRLALEGHRIGFVRSARATETRPSQPGKEYRRKVRTLTGVLQLCAWLPGVLIPVRNPIWIQFLCHKLLRLATPYLLATALAGGLAILLRDTNPYLWAAGLALILLASLTTRAQAATREILLLQAAVVTATVNSLRGRWDVW